MLRLVRLSTLPIATLTAGAAVTSSQNMEVPSPVGRRVDAHAVFNASPPFLAMLDRLEVRLLNICVAHIAEPSAAWKPLDPKSPHYSYYAENPDWYMYGHPERPSKEQLVRYQDRVLYATDLTFMPWDDAQAASARFEAEYARDLRYFATSELITREGRELRGLALPPEVLRKLFHDNAARWVPGIEADARPARSN